MNTHTLTPAAQAVQTTIAGSGVTRGELSRMAIKAGYRLECGQEEDGELHARYWWTLCAPGYDVETAEGDWATATEAEDDMLRAYLEDGGAAEFAQEHKRPAGPHPTHLRAAMACGYALNGAGGRWSWENEDAGTKSREYATCEEAELALVEDAKRAAREGDAFCTFNLRGAGVEV